MLHSSTVILLDIYVDDRSNEVSETEYTCILQDGFACTFVITTSTNLSLSDREQKCVKFCIEVRTFIWW